MASLKEGMPEAGTSPAYSQTQRATAKPDTGIEVQEAIGGLPPELEEAAVLYANGKIGETAALLNRYLLDHPDDRDPLPWYMLFDLYEASNQAAPFEDAAVDFAIRFERSPPTWSPRGPARSGSQAAPTLTYGEKSGALERVKQPRFMEDARHAPYVRLDFTRTQAPDDETARALVEDIAQLNRMKRPVELLGGPGFSVRLDAARQGGRLTEHGWFLLLAILQLRGKEEEFDNVAVDYAMAYEVSPPSYIEPLPLPDRAATSAAASEADATPGDTFPLAGIIGPGNESQLTALKAFAQGKHQVEADLSQVIRIDFAMVGLLLDTLIGITQTGCKVLFKEGNELVNTLLQIVGVSQFAMIMGRTRV